jgi:hypothetical protein
MSEKTVSAVRPAEDYSDEELRALRDQPGRDPLTIALIVEILRLRQEHEDERYERMERDR